MSKLLRSAVALAIPCVTGLAWGAEPWGPQVYSVLGLRAPDGPPVAELVSRFRQALSRQSAAGTTAVVQSEADTRASLGLQSAPTAALITRIVTTGLRDPPDHRNHRDPGTTPMILRRFSARADSA